MVEPWLRGTLGQVDAVRRQVLHALELSAEDVARWCSELSEEELAARPFQLAPVAFHLRHVTRSLDRLLTYAESRALDESQLAALQAEMQPSAGSLAEFYAGLKDAAGRISCLTGSYQDMRFVGRSRLPTTVGGLMVHCAEHTQRHVGQAIVTAKVVVGMRTL